MAESDHQRHVSVCLVWLCGGGPRKRRERVSELELKYE